MIEVDENEEETYSLSEEHAIDLVHKWREILIPDKRWQFTISVKYDADDVKGKHYRNRMGLCAIETAYFEATIQFHDFNIHDEHDANYVACHEVVHVVLAQAQGVIDDALDGNPQTAKTILENTVETVTRALLALEKAAAKAIAALEAAKSLPAKK